MSSILTNNGAMVALQTLQGINANMAKTQSEISTGKSVATAKDNAAVWAISKVMESDVKGFEGISDSLALGESTVAVGRNAAESVTELLKEVKGKIVSAQEANVSREKLQTDLEALTEQVRTVVGSAQFNGLNLVNGKSANPVNVLSSLDRQEDGAVTASSISIATSDLRAGVNMTAFDTAAPVAIVDNGGTPAPANVGAALAFQGGAGALALTASTADESDATAMLAGDVVSMTIGDATYSYTVQAGNTATEVAAGLNQAVADANVTGITIAAATDQLTVDNNSGAEIAVSMDVARGGMGALSGMDLTTDAGAADALQKIEGLIQRGIDAGASFGSAEKRIEIQKDFVGKLTNSLKSGIGAMVDANMEETSARLQALQVQQQLGTQSLSIANQAPQALLSLFR